MNEITAAVVVHLRWNDTANEWEVIPADLESHALDWSYEDDGRPYGDDASPGPLARATGHTVTAEDLAHMLGFEMVRTTAPANADVTHRPVSPALVDMIDGVIKQFGSELRDQDVRAMIRGLLPIFSSVDANAFGRGQREGVATDGLRNEIRKAISDAYYEARNSGATMEGAADNATDDVLTVLGGAR